MTLEKENLEQARLLGMSGQREAALLARVAKLERVLGEALEYVRAARMTLKYQSPGREFYPNREGAEACEDRIVAVLGKGE